MSLMARKKEQMAYKCHFYKKLGYYQKNCKKHKAWFKKKGKLYVFVCFESNLIEVPNNTWWYDFGATTHVSNMMQGFLSIQATNPTKDFLYIGNCM